MSWLMCVRLFSLQLQKSHRCTRYLEAFQSFLRMPSTEIETHSLSHVSACLGHEDQPKATQLFEYRCQSVGRKTPKPRMHTACRADAQMKNPHSSQCEWEKDICGVPESLGKIECHGTSVAD